MLLNNWQRVEMPLNRQTKPKLNCSFVKQHFCGQFSLFSCVLSTSFCQFYRGPRTRKVLTPNSSGYLTIKNVHQQLVLNVFTVVSLKKVCIDRKSNQFRTVTIKAKVQYPSMLASNKETHPEHQVQRSICHVTVGLSKWRIKLEKRLN